MKYLFNFCKRPMKSNRSIANVSVHSSFFFFFLCIVVIYVLSVLFILPCCAQHAEETLGSEAKTEGNVENDIGPEYFHNDLNEDPNEGLEELLDADDDANSGEHINQRQESGTEGNAQSTTDQSFEGGQYVPSYYTQNDKQNSGEQQNFDDAHEVMSTGPQQGVPTVTQQQKQNKQDTAQQQQQRRPKTTQQQQQNRRETAQPQQQGRPKATQQQQQGRPRMAKPQEQGKQGVTQPNPTVRPKVTQPYEKGAPTEKQQQKGPSMKKQQQEQGIPTDEQAKKSVKSPVGINDLDADDAKVPPFGPFDSGNSREDEGRLFTESDSPGNNTESSLIYEWETHMQNFVPEMLVTFSLHPRSDEYFYEDVGDEPVYIRGGYFVSADEDQSDVDFTITDPAGDIIYKKTFAEGLFYFHTKLAGTYSFILSNHRWMETKSVTFAIGKGNETALQLEHLSTVDKNIMIIEQQLKDVQAESQYLWIRQKSHMTAVESMNNRVFWFAFLELLCLLCVVAFQIYYIKSLVSDKRIL